MWYRVAINLSNLQGFSPVETSVVSRNNNVGSIPDKLVSNLNNAEEKVDNIYYFGGMDPESEKFQNFANDILEVSHQLVPVISAFIKIVDRQTPIQTLINKQFGLTGLLADSYQILEVCRQLEHIEDPELRVRKFTEYFRASGGMHGVLTGLLAAFNIISKFLYFIAHLDVHSPIDFSSVFMGVSIAEYFYEETKDDKDKSGVDLLKSKIVNPHIEFLINKNPRNKIVVNYVTRLIKDRPELRHDEVRDNALEYFLRDKKSRFRDLPGSKFYYLDIVHIVDNLYEDPHDQIPILRGRRINKEYADKVMDFMGSAPAIQMKINRAVFNLNKLILMLPHV